MDTISWVFSGIGGMDTISWVFSGIGVVVVAWVGKLAKGYWHRRRQGRLDPGNASSMLAEEKAGALGQLVPASVAEVFALKQTDPLPEAKPPAPELPPSDEPTPPPLLEPEPPQWNPTPLQVMERVNEAPPLRRAALCESWVGYPVTWTLRLGSGSAIGGGVVRLYLRYKGESIAESVTVKVEVLEKEHPFLDFLEEGATVHLKGTILEVDAPLWISVNGRVNWSDPAAK